MSTTHGTHRAERHKTSRSNRPLSRLMKGFDSLTLDPSPSLKELRKEIESSNTVAEAWIATGKALADAMRHQS